MEITHVFKSNTRVAFRVGDDEFREGTVLMLGITPRQVLVRFDDADEPQWADAERLESLVEAYDEGTNPSNGWVDPR